MDPLHTLLDAWPREFAQTLEMMTGTPAKVEIGPADGHADLWWENRFQSDPAITLAVGASREGWLHAGSVILQAAGIDPVEEAEARSTWLEVLEQAASSSARALGTATGKTVETASGHEVPQGIGKTWNVTVDLDGQPVVLLLALQAEAAALRPAEVSQPQPASAMAAAAGAGGGNNAPASGFGMAPMANGIAAPVTSRTMDALLDVQLPVSISFGQAKIPLKDVLKLTTGSVVELNRQPEDPVDIIVNDCVIARGEVVVVDGNYAVRIQSILGRQQRLNLRNDRGANGGSL